MNANNSIGIENRNSNRKINFFVFRIVFIIPFILLFFISNANFMGLYLVFPIFFSCICLLAFNRIPFINGRIFAIGIFFFLVLIFLLDSSTFLDSYSDYYIWPLLLLLSVPIVYFMSVEKENSLKDYIFCGVLFFLVGSMFFQDEDKITAIFGANILYRIALMFYGLIGFRLIKDRSILKFAIHSIVFLSLINMIDSRAGQILYLFMLLIFVLYLINPRLKNIVYPISSAIFLFSFADLQNIFSFLQNFGINLSIYNASESYRFFMIQELLSPNIVFDNNITIRDIFQIYGSYPHSIFVESFAYHGIVFGSLVFIMMSYLLFKLINKVEHLYLLGFVAGPLFSGDMRDNFHVFIIAFFFVFVENNKKRRLID